MYSSKSLIIFVTRNHITKLTNFEFINILDLSQIEDKKIAIKNNYVFANVSIKFNNAYHSYTCFLKNNSVTGNIGGGEGVQEWIKAHFVNHEFWISRGGINSKINQGVTYINIVSFN